jgi:hypothetical protein
MGAASVAPFSFPTTPGVILSAAKNLLLPLTLNYQITNYTITNSTGHSERSEESAVSVDSQLQITNFQITHSLWVPNSAFNFLHSDGFRHLTNSGGTMRENRDALRTSLSFVAGALCGAGVVALLDENRRNQIQRIIPDTLNQARVGEQYASDADLTSIVREQLRDLCDADRVSIEVKEGHVTVWGGLNQNDAAHIAARLKELPLITSFYVQPDDTRHMREFRDEHGVAGREQARDAQLLVA